MNTDNDVILGYASVPSLPPNSHHRFRICSMVDVTLVSIEIITIRYNY